MVEVISQSTNIACREDNKRTWRLFPFIVSSVFTLGIYPLIWHCQVIDRFRDYCKRNGKECPVSKKFYLCWTLLGWPIIIGPFIAIARFLRAFSHVCTIYNSTHTFPLSKEEMEIEHHILKKPMPLKKRRSLIDQISEPIIEINNDDETVEVVTEISTEDGDNSEIQATD
jgi:hypothetical protein